MKYYTNVFVICTRSIKLSKPSRKFTFINLLFEFLNTSAYFNNSKSYIVNVGNLGSKWCSTYVTVPRHYLPWRQSWIVWRRRFLRFWGALLSQLICNRPFFLFVSFCFGYFNTAFWTFITSNTLSESISLLFQIISYIYILYSVCTIFQILHERHPINYYNDSGSDRAKLGRVSDENVWRWSNRLKYVTIACSTSPKILYRASICVCAYKSCDPATVLP